MADTSNGGPPQHDAPLWRCLQDGRLVAGGGGGLMGGSGHKGDLDKKELRAHALCLVTSL